MLNLLSTIDRAGETGKTMFERMVSTIGNYLFAGLFANIRDALKFWARAPGRKDWPHRSIGYPEEFEEGGNRPQRDFSIIAALCALIVTAIAIAVVLGEW
jgi:hypothetical protein